jgi:hypothetical protein
LHGLINADEFLDKCRLIKSGAILCGHVHEMYRVSVNDLKSDIYCAGSATMEGYEGFWVYELDETYLQAKQVYWNKTDYCFTGSRLLSQIS